MSHATFTFGRFNPPTEEGHGKLVSHVQAHAEENKGKHYIFPSHSQDAKKNPLTHSEKVGAMRKLFPSAHVVSDKNVRTPIDALKHLEKQGHTHVTMVVGSDRVNEFHKTLNQYNGKEYNFKKIEVKSAGHRDPDAEGAEGMSASKLRGLVKSGKKDEFISHYSDPKVGKMIHDKVKKGMQLESVHPVAMVLLGGPGSGKDYVLKNIFNRFGLVEVQIDQLLSGKASNFIESKQNIVVNSTADSVEKLEQVKSLLEGYVVDYVLVSVSNKSSRLRNESRDRPLREDLRISKWYKIEKLKDLMEDVFIFDNTINLSESTELEQLMFSSQIEGLLARLVENGLDMIAAPEVIQEEADINEAFNQAVGTPVDTKPTLKPKAPRTGKLRVPPNPYNSQVGGGGGSNVFGGLMPQVAVEDTKPKKMKKFSDFSCSCKK